MVRIVSEFHRSSAVSVGDDRPRTARTLRLGERSGSALPQAPESSPDDQSAIPSPPRSGASIRSEKAAANYAATKHDRRSVVAREKVANDFSEALHARQLSGDEAYSNVGIGRACDADEKTIAKWRSAEKPLPVWALHLMPNDLYREVIAGVDAARRGRIAPRELPNVRPLLSRLDAQLASEDPAIALRELVAAARLLESMIARLTSGAR